jgi:hypothetical protein
MELIDNGGWAHPLAHPCSINSRGGQVVHRGVGACGNNCN